MKAEFKDQETGNSQSALETLQTIEELIGRAGKEVDGFVIPVRQTLFKRYPTLFLLLTSLGVTAVFLGLERILLEIPLFEDNPWFLFLLGVAILAVTGRLYKKLG